MSLFVIGADDISQIKEIFLNLGVKYVQKDQHLVYMKST